MRLVRNTNPEGHGKFALVNLEKLHKQFPVRDGAEYGENPAYDSLEYLKDRGFLTYGAPGSDDEFFVIKLKDVHARAALTAYAASCSDPELAADVHELASRAGVNHPHCKHPD